MIERYTSPEMGKIWDLKNRFQKMLDVEIAACEAWAELGKIPRQALLTIKKKARIDVDLINEIEQVTRHDVIAFITSLEKCVGEDSKYIHLGLTSSDVIDTAFALLVREASELIMEKLNSLCHLLKKMASAHKLTYMIGRTHGVHSEVITFGFKLAIWYQECKRNIERFKQAVKEMACGKISGAVGTYSNLDPRLETIACKILKLEPAKISSQIIQRDRYAYYMQILALMGTFIEKIALEIRLLQKTETLDLEEPFSKGQKGSSAMPHKHNPILCEQMTGLARVLRSNSLAALENNALWHERDISHSSVERIIFPDSTILIHYMLNKVIYILQNLKVNKEKMIKNIYTTKGLIFSQNVLTRLIEKGLLRNQAYELVQRIANEAWKTENDFIKMINSDPQIREHLSSEEIDNCFDYRSNENKILKAIQRALK
ncbi:MAG: adenylosuccinate lyase [Spirochaetes bacterium]|nr:adenylosuccinate lyase [Spirochaetota bacterium]